RREYQEDNAEKTQQRELFVESRNSKRDADRKLKLNDRAGENVANRPRGAKIAVASHHEVQHATGRQEAHRTRGKPQHAWQRAGDQRGDKEQRHPDRDVDREPLQDGACEHAAPCTRIVEGKDGRREYGQKYSEHLPSAGWSDRWHVERSAS